MAAELGTEKPSTPNLDKMLEINEQSQIIGEFVQEFLQHEKNIVLAEWREWDEEEEVENWNQSYAAIIGNEPKKMHTVTRHYGPELVQIGTDIQRLLSEFFKIDYDEMQRERERVLDYVRAVADRSAT